MKPLAVIGGSSVVERSAVNRLVVGSNPTRRAKTLSKASVAICVAGVFACYAYYAVLSVNLVPQVSSIQVKYA